MRIIAVLPAAGSGRRAGSGLPKQYLKFGGRELIVHTLLIFQKCRLIDEIAVAVHPDYFSLIKKLKSRYRLTKLRSIVAGGKERQDSVYSVLNSISAEPDDLISVHDAARPFLSPELLTKALITAKEKGNSLVCLKAKDTLVKEHDSGLEYIDRSTIYYVQTPQTFTFASLKMAMDKAAEDGFTGTDESMLVSRTGEKINLVEGSALNFKITTTEDIQLARRLLRTRT